MILSKPRGQFRYARGRMPADALEHVAQVGGRVRIQPVLKKSVEHANRDEACSGHESEGLAQGGDSSQKPGDAA